MLTGGKSVELGSDSAIYQLCDLEQLIDLSGPQVLREYSSEVSMGSDI